ncbi:hypothetical protein GOBAR_DD22345 [Gossypium barbadense]|nr:hypothetical protein GOBAR_DD22345 [Gossypium barbadense]
MRRLKLELKQTMEMCSTAYKEALTAKQKARELQLWKLEEARLAEEAALAIAEKEKAKSKAAMEIAEAAQRIAEIELKKRVNAEMKALKESAGKKGTRCISTFRFQMQHKEGHSFSKEVLSCIGHPNVVFLLGACLEYGCLVYEFMSNGSLEDRLFRRRNTPTLS